MIIRIEIGKLLKGETSPHLKDSEPIKERYVSPTITRGATALAIKATVAHLYDIVSEQRLHTIREGQKLVPLKPDGDSIS